MADWTIYELSDFDTPPAPPIKRGRGRPRKDSLPVTRPKGVAKYGLLFPVGTPDLTIELYCFRCDRAVEAGGLGAKGHFIEVANMLWGPQNKQKQFVWHPWALRMLEEALRWKYLSISGCASSGKSDWMAIYAIICWLAAPMMTKVLVTSTSLKEAQGRVWGSIESYWNAAQHHCGGLLPGKLVPSIGRLRLEDPTGEYKSSDKVGIELIAGEKRKEKDAISKLIGVKQIYLILLADELADLSPALITAAKSNLDNRANPNFQLIGASNPNSIYDPHGDISRPKGGWKSVNPEMESWETELGFHIRFDAEKSPNILAGKIIYPWLPTAEFLEQKRKQLGPDSNEYWRMWKAYWSPHGSHETVISEADLIKFNCEENRVQWKGSPADIAFCDPAYTSGGDRSCACAAKLGETVEGKMVLLYTGYEFLHEDASRTNQPRNFQIAEKFKKFCDDRKIAPDRAALDESGAGGPFADILQMLWSKQITRINFGGKASEDHVSAQDKTRCCDRYFNRVTQIWAGAREYIRCEQVRGVDPDMGVEMTSRRMKSMKGAIGLKVQVEPKADMRARTDKSPDIADAALGLLFFARTKFKFKAAAKGVLSQAERKNWLRFRMEQDKVNHVVSLDRAA